MSKEPLPVVSGAEAIKVFKAVGYSQSRQKGSHVRLKCPGKNSLTVPLHDELAKGTLRALIRDAGITVEEFASHL